MAEFASKGVAGTGLGLGIAGTALGLGIAGTALWLLNGAGNGGGILGKLTGGGSTGTDSVSAGTAIMSMINARKECSDVLALTNKIWEGAYAAQVNNLPRSYVPR